MTGIQPIPKAKRPVAKKPAPWLESHTTQSIAPLSSVAAAAGMPSPSSGDVPLARQHSKAPSLHPAQQLQAESSQQALHTLGNFDDVLDFLQLARVQLQQRQQQQQDATAVIETSAHPLCTSDREDLSAESNSSHDSACPSESTSHASSPLSSPSCLVNALFKVSAVEPEMVLVIPPVSTTETGPSPPGLCVPQARGVTWVPGLLHLDCTDEQDHEKDAVNVVSDTAVSLKAKACASRRMLSIDEPTSSSGGGVSSEAELPDEDMEDVIDTDKRHARLPIKSSNDPDIERQAESLISRVGTSTSLGSAVNEQEQAPPVGDEVVLKKKRPWWAQRTLKQMKRLFFAELEQDFSPTLNKDALTSPTSLSTVTLLRRLPVEQASDAPPSQTQQGLLNSKSKATKRVSDYASKTSGIPKQDILTSEERQYPGGKGGSRGIHDPKDRGYYAKHNLQQQQQRHETKKVYIFIDNSNILAGYYNYYRLHYPDTDEDEDDDVDQISNESGVDETDTQAALTEPMQPPLSITDKTITTAYCTGAHNLKTSPALLSGLSLSSGGSDTDEDEVVLYPRSLPLKSAEPAEASNFIPVVSSKPDGPNVDEVAVADEVSLADIPCPKSDDIKSEEKMRMIKTHSDKAKPKKHITSAYMMDGTTEKDVGVVSSGDIQQPTREIQMTRGSEFLPKFRYSLFFQLLERNRHVVKKELVGSSPLHQALDEAMNHGYEVRVLKRVKKLLEGQLGAVPVPVKQLRYPPGQHAANNGSVNSLASATSNSSSKPTTSTKHERRASINAAVPPSKSFSNASTDQGATAATIEVAEPPDTLHSILLGVHPIVETSSSDHAFGSTTMDVTMVDLQPLLLDEIGLTIGQTDKLTEPVLAPFDNLRSLDMLAIASDFAHGDVGAKREDPWELETASLKVARSINTTNITTTTFTDTAASCNETHADRSVLQGLPASPLKHHGIDPCYALPAIKSVAEPLAPLVAAEINQSTAKVKEEKEDVALATEKATKSSAKKKSRSQISKDILSSMVTIRGEQCVDELLHLKMLETLLDYEPGVMVLATGDGAPSEYGGGGFYDVVKRALDRGWLVEIVSWEDQLSGCYLDLVQEYGSHGLGSWPTEAGSSGHGAALTTHTPTPTMSIESHQKHQYHRYQHHRPHSQYHHSQQHQHQSTEIHSDIYRRDHHRYPYYQNHALHHAHHHASQDSRLARSQHLQQQSYARRRGTIRVICLDWLGDKFI